MIIRLFKWLCSTASRNQQELVACKQLMEENIDDSTESFDQTIRTMTLIRESGPTAVVTELKRNSG